MLVVAVLAARPAAAYEAMLSWKSEPTAVGYKVYVGYDRDVIGQARNVGSPRIRRGNVVRTVIDDIVLGPTAHISVTAYNAKGKESKSSKYFTLAYAYVAKVIDSDGDGLTDAEEDVDLDRRRGPGETDPKRYDSDGDGASDGEERSVGTNPLDPASVSICTGVCSKSVWMRAARRVRYTGAMMAGSRFARGADSDPRADSLAGVQVFANSTQNSLEGGSGDQAHYRVTLPAPGVWYLWGRFYYPAAPNSNGANSFFAQIDGGILRKFGNNKDRFQRWHWDGNGDVETGPPLPLSLGWRAAGAHELVIEKREVQPIAPRLDVLVLSQDPKYVPNDRDALSALR